MGYILRYHLYIYINNISTYILPPLSIVCECMSLKELKLKFMNGRT